MSALTCPEVKELIDLHAAGACDAATDAAMRRHLATCPDCACARREAERLQALLDSHYRTPDALERLHRRLDAEARPRRERARRLPLQRRAAVLAAVVLLTVGLTWLMRPFGERLPSDEAVAILWASPDTRR
jgi:ferric-dicitrate binding protein FerR (iron transport regulator)